MHQYLFFIGDFPVRMYGLMLCTAIFMATAVAYFLAWRDGRGWEKYLPDLGIYGGFCGLIGARLWDVFFFDWGYYSQHLAEIPFVWQGGMAIQGGILGGVLGGAVYCWRHQVDWIDMLDVICPALFIGQSVGRMANLLNGDAFGAPTGGDFGILYPAGTLARSTYGAVPLWPAEVWEGQVDVILFALLLGIFALGAPGVPGGTVMASLGLITGVLGFDETGTALMLTIFALQDSFGTACNVTGDGALTLILTGYAEKNGIAEAEVKSV